MFTPRSPAWYNLTEQQGAARVTTPPNIIILDGTTYPLDGEENERLKAVVREVVTRRALLQATDKGSLTLNYAGRVVSCQFSLHFKPAA
jgi:energy-coupling factor transporter ATP-binding protein EcfA2